MKSTLYKLAAPGFSLVIEVRDGMVTRSSHRRQRWGVGMSLDQILANPTRMARIITRKRGATPSIYFEKTTYSKRIDPDKFSLDRSENFRDACFWLNTNGPYNEFFEPPRYLELPRYIASKLTKKQIEYVQDNLEF